MVSLVLITILLTDLQGEVIAVSDGDTVKILVEKIVIVVRLAGIDAPENRQPFGQQSKSALSSLVFGKHIRVVTSGKDRYGRTLGTLYDGETNVNAEMVRIGFAWHYRRFSSDIELASLECEARTNSRGLWADPRPVEPWEFRNRTR